MTVLATGKLPKFSGQVPKATSTVFSKFLVTTPMRKINEGPNVIAIKKHKTAKKKKHTHSQQQ